MDLFEAIVNRKTTNTKFIEKKVSDEHIKLLIKMATHSPSHFNSQPWKFIVINDEHLINSIAKIAAEAMENLMKDGRFWKQYRKYFRFTSEEIEKTKDGILIDHLPAILKPFVKTIFSEKGGKVMAKFKVPKILAKDEEKLVASSPLLLAICLTKQEYKPQELSGFYSLISLGAVVQTLWLVTTAIGMGMQFISTPGEIPEKWKLISDMLNIPNDYELCAVFRMGYIEKNVKRPTIDWTSSQRKPIDETTFMNQWGIIYK